MASGDILVYIASEDTSQEILKEVKKIGAAVMADAAAFDWKSYFAARATGEIFTTKFQKYETSTSPAGEKMNASTGLEAVPSTELAAGKDDFATHNAFTAIDCNFIIDTNGKRIPTRIVGQNGFSYTGKVDVGVLVPQTYWGIEDFDTYYLIHFSDKPHEDMGLVPTPWCRDDKGNVLGYGIVTKYYAGKIDGILYSASGLAVNNFISHDSGHTEMQKKGSGYQGSGAARSAYLLTMLWIKYATKHSQSVFQGCTSYNFQYKVAQAETAKNYVTLTATQSANCYAGGCVSLGNPGTNTNYDRGNTYMRDIADKVKVTAIETVDDTTSRVYLDMPAKDIPSTAYLSSMPCYSGTTDSLLGLDGQQKNDGKHAFKLGGVEEGIGAYYVSLDEIQNKETAETTSYYHRNGATWSNTSVAGYRKIGSVTNAGYQDKWIGDIRIDLTSGVSFPRLYGSGDSVGTGDRYYYGGNGTGLREKLERGILWDGSDAGLSCLSGWSGLSAACWYCAVCV